MNFDRLHFVAERAELGEHREAIFAATIPETPGSFKRFCELLGKRNITEFNYRYADQREAQVFVGVNVRNRNELPELLTNLNAAHIATVDLSDNEMAKLHIRHLVGGRAPQAGDELLYRFEFPERPGALMDFLHALGQQRNISLFHYRNHGADTARVLVGLQVSPDDKATFHQALNQMRYGWTEETFNPAYRLFLGA
jgi:threonine dehydratase